MDMPDLANSYVGAQNLLGWKLVHETPEGVTAGYIVETEAYTMEDPASHTYRGETQRNRAMFQEAGTVYVYFTYGMHYCVNIVTGNKGHGEGVLIRALEPAEGIEVMQQRRGDMPIKQLTNGPAKLTQAMGIGKQHNCSTLNLGNLRIEPGIKPGDITQTIRVGISRAQEQPWRFYITDNPFVSKP